jgi:hypothetical protein
MSVYDFFDFKTTIKKGTVLCNFEKEGNKYYLTLDYSLYYLIQKFRKELKPLFIYFYNIKTDIIFDVIDKNVMKRNGVELNEKNNNEKDIEQILEIQVDYIPFLPLIKSKEFYHYHEHKLKRNDKKDNFWNSSLNEQIDILGYLENPWSKTILILSLMINTDLNVYGKFKRKSETKWGSYLYKIQNHSLILFDLDGDENFKKKRIIELLKTIDYYHIMIIHIPEYVNNNLKLNTFLDDDKWIFDDELLHFKQWKIYSLFEHEKKIEMKQIGDKICIAHDDKLNSNEKNIDILKDDFIHKQYNLSDFQNKTLENGIKTIEIQNEIIKKQNDAIQTISSLDKNQNMNQNINQNMKTSKQTEQTTIPTLEEVENILENQNNQLDNSDIETILRNTGMDENQINNIL